MRINASHIWQQINWYTTYRISHGLWLWFSSSEFIKTSRNLTLRKSYYSPHSGNSISVKGTCMLTMNRKKFSHFHLLLKNYWTNFILAWLKNPLVDGIQICSNEGPRPFPRGDNSKNIKMIPKTLKIFFFRTTWSISTKLGTKHPLVVVIHVSSNEGPCPFSKGDNYEIAEIHWRN